MHGEFDSSFCYFEYTIVVKHLRGSYDAKLSSNEVSRLHPLLPRIDLFVGFYGGVLYVFHFCRYVFSHCAMKAWSCQTTSRRLVISVQFLLPTHSVHRQLPEKSADMLRISMINK